MTTATSLRPVTLLQQRETYLSILKDLTIMDDIFMQQRSKRQCLYRIHIKGHYGPG